MNNLDTSSLRSIADFQSKLRDVEGGDYYLRVTYKNGTLSYDTTRKATNLIGRLVQLITRWFDSSYDIKRATALVTKTFHKVTFEKQPEVTKSLDTLKRIVEHVNSHRFFNQVKISEFLGNGLERALKEWTEGSSETSESRKNAVNQIREWAKTPVDGERRNDAAKIIFETWVSGSRYADLSKYGLKSLPPAISSIPSLKKIYLGSTTLDNLPPGSTKMISPKSYEDLKKSLDNWTTAHAPDEKRQEAVEKILENWLNEGEYLNLSNLGLTSLPPEIGDLTFLKDLVLSNNKLTSLPSQIGNLTSLTKLSLAHNKLESLLPEIGKLTSLESLDIAHNSLSALPPEMGNLTKLRILNLIALSDRAITFPPEMDKLTSLETINVYRERFTPSPEIEKRVVNNHIRITNSFD